MKEILFAGLFLIAASGARADDVRKDFKSPHIPCNQQSGFYCGDKQVEKTPKMEKKKEKDAYTQLKDSLTGAEVSKEGGKIKVTFRGGMLFDTGSAQVSSRARQDLSQLTSILKTHPKTKVRIDGHTDNQGDAALNKDLSMRRADAVSDLLTADGVEKSRIQTKGYGDAKPVASNDTADGRQANRRVEIFLD